ncbi:hypothetical protein FQA39_LY06898 [Lamprigera yunnana]|nr:hypothetical protein FQA39_LY06898 [Lamprigera yunnana]
MSSTLRRKHLHAQAREMAFNVYQWIKSQNEDHSTKEIKEKVSRATGVSVRTIEKIIKEGNTSPEAETDKRFKTEPEFSSVTLEDWVSRCKHVIKTESDYMQNEQLIDIRTEKLIISVNGKDSDSDVGIDF